MNGNMTSPLLLDLPAHIHMAQVTERDFDDLPLHPAENELLGLSARQARRKTFRLGRAAAHLALQELGLDDHPVLSGEAGEPIWPDGVVGSIAHADGVGIAAVASSQACSGIGIDIEAMIDFETLPQHVAFDIELERLVELDARERQRGVFEVFSVKESIFKAFYPRVGRFFSYESARVAPSPSGGLEAWLVDELDEAFSAGEPFPVNLKWSGDRVASAVILDR